MADTKISAMTAATNLTDATVPIVQGGVNKKADISLFGTTGYKVYTALLSQTGTDAPVATVLQNTLGGTVVWTRYGVGAFYATLTGAFPYAKTHILAMADANQGGSSFRGGGDFGNDDRLTFFNFALNGIDTYQDPDTGASGYFAHVEIRVYP